MEQFWGKYRGIVVGDQDPLMLGRLRFRPRRCWARR